MASAVAMALTAGARPAAAAPRAPAVALAARLLLRCAPRRAAADPLPASVPPTHLRRARRRSAPRAPAAAAAAAAAAAEAPPLPPADPASRAAVRAFLLGAGWDLAWVDGVTTEMRRGALATDVARCAAVLETLASLGLGGEDVENMAAICKPILARSPEQLRAVADWAVAGGVTPGKELAHLLRQHPNVSSAASLVGQSKQQRPRNQPTNQPTNQPLTNYRPLPKIKSQLLTFEVAPGGKQLARGAARAALDFDERGGKRAVGVTLWREGAAFGTAPVSPRAPPS